MYGVVGTDGVVYGPVPASALFEWVAQGRIVPGTILIDWQGRHVPAASVPELQGAFNVYPHPDTMPLAPGGKSKRTALWLAFLLGFAGAHRFYLGHRATGFAMLALNLVACGAGIRLGIMIAIGATVWLGVDMAMIVSGSLREADGRPLA